MSTVALGIAPNTGNIGVTPLVHRRILGAQFANCGIIDGLNVTGRNDLRYNVGAGVAVCSRGDSDGKTIAYHEGGQTPAVSAGDPSNPRIDIVWICAHNQLEYKDSDNYVPLGVTQGTPSANPAERRPAPPRCGRRTTPYHTAPVSENSARTGTVVT